MPVIDIAVVGFFDMGGGLVFKPPKFIYFQPTRSINLIASEFNLP